METGGIKIITFTSLHETEWDEFIENSVNGTFLQCRKFLNYHGDRFVDCSLMLYREEELVCVCPACVINENGTKIFWSHKGSTFGGLVLAAAEYKAEKVIELIKSLKSYLDEQNYAEVYLKITGHLFSVKEPDLLEYCLWHEGFENLTEISTYVDLADCTDDLAANFNRTLRRYRNRWLDAGAEFSELKTIEEISAFYQLLEDNLGKHGASPIHTLDELIDLKFNRFPDEMVFYGTFLDNEMVAGCLLFKFIKTKAMHMQYVATSQDIKNDLPSPAAFTYYSMMNVTREHDFARISWGTSTFEQGRILNDTLIRFKERVGSRYSQNNTYHWKRGLEK